VLWIGDVPDHIIDLVVFPRESRSKSAEQKDGVHLGRVKHVPLCVVVIAVSRHLETQNTTLFTLEFGVSGLIRPSNIGLFAQCTLWLSVAWYTVGFSLIKPLMARCRQEREKRFDER